MSDELAGLNMSIANCDKKIDSEATKFVAHTVGKHDMGALQANVKWNTENVKRMSNILEYLELVEC